MVKLGLVGVGVMGHRYIKAASTDPNAEMVALCDLNEYVAKDVATLLGVPAAYGGITEMIEAADLDAVIVATPDFAHRDAVCECLEAGLDVLCEKPLAISVDEACEMVRAVDRTGRKLMVNFGNRHRLSVQRMARHVRAGALGDIRYAYMCLNEKAIKTATLPWAEQTSPLWFLLSHVTDFLTWILDQRVVRVYAANGRVASSPEMVTTAALLTFENGASATLESTWNMPEHYPRDIDLRLALQGSKGAIDLDMGQQGLMLAEENRSGQIQWDMTEDQTDPDDWWNRSCRYFSRCLANGETPVPDAVSGLRTTMVLSALQHSLDTGQAVEVAALFPDAAALAYK
jgi:predicted dehydrogenase